jgi:hypothetical protein
MSHTHRILQCAAGLAQAVRRLSYRLDGRGVEVRFQAGARDIFFNNVDTGSEAHLSSYAVYTGSKLKLWRTCITRGCWARFASLWFNT